jgi:hypothetical protein
MRISKILLALAISVACLIATASCGDDMSGGRVTDGGVMLPDGGMPPPSPMPPYVNSPASNEAR